MPNLFFIAGFAGFKANMKGLSLIYYSQIYLL